MPQDFQEGTHSQLHQGHSSAIWPHLPCWHYFLLCISETLPRKFPFPTSLFHTTQSPPLSFQLQQWAAPAMPFGYHHYKWWRKDNLKVKMGKQQSWNKGESSQIESLNNSFENYLGVCGCVYEWGLCLCWTYKLSKGGISLCRW